MKETVEKLRALKGMLLMSSNGSLYVLTNYTYVEDELVETGGFFRKKKELVSYISSVTLNNGTPIKYSALSNTQWVVNHLIDDRNRYLRLQRDLSYMGYAIRKK